MISARRSILKMAGGSKKRKRLFGTLFSSKKMMRDGVMNEGIGKPSVYHAIIVIFLEFFAWGLLANPMITVLNDTFPDHIFLMNGLIQGIKGILSFLSAPIIGALSDVWGRKSFLLITVFCTCFPIPLMRISPWWYFAMISISGVFSVTFSVVLAYVADVTDEKERSFAYGLVSATFAASLITSPAIGEYLTDLYSENLVIALASAIALFDVLFIMVAVPESLPDKLRHHSSSSSGSAASLSLGWAKADPCASLRQIGKDNTILMLCIITFLSYLPEAGQYSSFFVYLRLIMGFSKKEVASFIAVIGILSVFAQTTVMAFLIRTVGNKHTVIIGLLFQIMQLTWYGFGAQKWMMWGAGCLASISSIVYPAISSYLSVHSDADKQGAVQGMVTGVRGLCNGLGPAMFGFIFYLFHVDVSPSLTNMSGENAVLANSLPHAATTARPTAANNHTNIHQHQHPHSPYQMEHIPFSERLLPGPPFLFGAVLVMLALMVAVMIPDEWHLVIKQLQRGGDCSPSAAGTSLTITGGSSHRNNGDGLQVGSGGLAGRRVDSIIDDSECSGSEVILVSGSSTPLTARHHSYPQSTSGTGLVEARPLIDHS